MTWQNISKEQEIAIRVTLLVPFWDCATSVSKVVAWNFSRTTPLSRRWVFNSLSWLSYRRICYFLFSQLLAKVPDENHPMAIFVWTLTTVFSAWLELLIVALGIAYWNLSRQPAQQSASLGMARGPLIATIGIKAAIFQYTKKAEHRIGSKIVIANACTRRSGRASLSPFSLGLITGYFGCLGQDIGRFNLVALLIGKMANHPWCGEKFGRQLGRYRTDQNHSSNQSNGKNSLKHVWASR